MCVMTRWLGWKHFHRNRSCSPRRPYQSHTGASGQSRSENARRRLLSSGFHYREDSLSYSQQTGNFGSESWSSGFVKGVIPEFLSWINFRFCSSIHSSIIV